jgi:hypothetical protein
MPVGEGMHGSVQSGLLKSNVTPRTEDYRLALDRQTVSEQEQDEMEDWLSDMGYL